MKKIFRDENVERVLRNSKLCEEAAKKVWNFKVTDFIIDNKTFNFTHPTWKGTWCKGGNSRLETVILIQKYCKECKKVIGKRNFSFLHLVIDE